MSLGWRDIAPSARPTAPAIPESANTPDDFPVEQFELIAFCDTCGHSAPIDRARIPPGLTIPALPARLRCTACGGRSCSIRIVYTGAGGYSHS